MSDGTQRFVDDLMRLGLEAEVVDGLVLYSVEAVDGARKGAPVRTGVAATEAQRWPAIPPHWVHLPSEVNFARTNTQASTKSGWTAHSRNINGWADESDHIRAWVAHVRGVLGEATS